MTFYVFKVVFCLACLTFINFKCCFYFYFSVGISKLSTLCGDNCKTWHCNPNLKVYRPWIIPYIFLQTLPVP
jgi:hypothetical protein